MGLVQSTHTVQGVTKSWAAQPQRHVAKHRGTGDEIYVTNMVVEQVVDKIVEHEMCKTLHFMTDPWYFNPYNCHKWVVHFKPNLIYISLIPLQTLHEAGEVW